MPANLSPEYKAAEAAFRRARDPKERLEWLREMLRTIPKHKGTDHLQADIKSRIKELTEELIGPRKGGVRSGPATVIHPEGAAQIALLGGPNVGKSALHAVLTGSHAETGPYPYTTQFPLPGMLSYEDIHFQLLDLPPVTPDHPVPWLASTLQPADGCLLLLDLSAAECVEQATSLVALLADRRVALTPRWHHASDPEPDTEDDPFALRLPTLMLASKADLCQGLEDELAVFQELSDLRLPALSVSARTGLGLDRIGPWLFEALQVVRVYTKAPGRPADKDRPFTVRRGQTVHHVARRIHKDLARDLKFARLWGGSHFQGQQVGPEHPVQDGNVVEIHT